MLSGHVDPGESEMQTAIRETKEESGISVSQLTIYEDFKRELNYEVNGKAKRVVYWLAKLNDNGTPVLLSDEHIAYEWLTLSEVKVRSGYSDMETVFEQAEEFIKSKVFT